MPYIVDKSVLILPPWLGSAQREYETHLQRGRVPQGLLIHGHPGIGRRYLALWLAARLLGVPGGGFAELAEGEGGAEGEEALVHPDLLLVRPPAGKTALPVEAVRGLTAFLQLKSHQGGARVALLWPAESMTIAAANSLLKTLEEPPVGGYILLVASAPTRLPATILSRCQRLRVAVPTREEGLRWLAHQDATVDWLPPLEFAGGAPLLALAGHRAGLTGQMENYVQDLADLRQRRQSPAALARKWASADAGTLTRWLYLQAAAAVRTHSANTRTAPLQNPAKPPTMPASMHACLERLREAEELYRNRTRAVAMDAQLAALLLRWYGEAA